MLKSMAGAGRVTVMMITHKFREVIAFAEHASVLRRGRLAGEGRVAELGAARLAEMMVGAREIPHASVKRTPVPVHSKPQLEIESLIVEDDAGLRAVNDVSLEVGAGEIVGIAGVSGNGQRELVQALIGQRAPRGGKVRIAGKPYGATRGEIRLYRSHSLPEEPLRNACVPGMSVAENLALRNFDEPPLARGPWLRERAIREQAVRLIAEFNVKTRGPDALIGTLSGGNVQRAVLARELSGKVSVLIAANPVFGLDFAAVADIHDRILAVRAAGAAVLLVSEDLDELLELSDRILVMFGGGIVHQTAVAQADIRRIGPAMAGHAHA
jgi:simple sugar transport system ATP-binding protein